MHPTTRPILIPIAAALVLAAQSACAREAPGAAGETTTAAAGPDAAPLDTRAPNARYQPAFPGQTRAPAAPATPVTVTTVASGLVNPWAIEFLPDGRMLVTEKPGRLRIVSSDGTLSPPATGVPTVFTDRQGGLHELALDPDFANNRTIYFTYAEPRTGGTNGTTVARARLVDGAQPRLEDVQVIFRQEPAWRSDLHFGARIVFAPDGTMFVGLGERSIPETRVQAQDLGGHLGKVIRINRDGSVPQDNPFIGRAGARPEIWSYGHRNIQSAALHPETNQLWTIEHGPRGGDELNLTEAGKNYGWPVIGYGIEYTGQEMPGSRTAQLGMEQPNYYWDPVIAPSGMAFYTGELFPGWRNNILVGGLVSEKLVRLVLDGDRVAAEEWLPLGKRIRDVIQGPDGAVYVVTDERRGEILRIAPRA